jgi:NADPH:quinone reductase-like Zn-dependent oxidoreductase
VPRSPFIPVSQVKIIVGRTEPESPSAVGKLSMKAIRMHRTGGPAVLKLEEVETPEPGPGELLIEVRAASVNPVDTKIRAGKFKMFQAQLPAIIGRDIAGVVRQVGRTPARGKSRRFKPGEAVFGMLDYDRGAYAEYTVASPREIARRPEKLGERDAATLGVAALTAWQGLFDHGRLRKGQRVLIHGGAGGVGHFAVQFAKVRGATIIATASQRDAAWVRQLGADQVIDYKNERFEDQTGNIDLVFDLIGGETLKRSWKVLKKGGAIISTLQEPSKAQARRHHARGLRMVVKVNRRQLSEIARLVVARRVRVKLAKVLPLVKARQAHELVEKGRFRGKVVLRIFDSA